MDVNNTKGNMITIVPFQPLVRVQSDGVRNWFAGEYHICIYSLSLHLVFLAGRTKHLQRNVCVWPASLIDSRRSDARSLIKQTNQTHIERVR